ncbi:hypothetical protein [Vibrio parahaemolyticus]|uniref:hypothetical protein n=1 Tax=Vibrio parahaemolyticus TaxID=670 RepID=UPI000812F919|nr:hypothetical protein [Vibrio parahaemolyticus]OCP68374.1 hypothetical protein AKH08_16310 [Vibrio parahaemolyticus]
MSFFNNEPIKFSQISCGVNIAFSGAIAILLAYSDYRWAALWVFGFMTLFDVILQEKVTKKWSRHPAVQSFAWVLEVTWSVFTAFIAKEVANWLFELLNNTKVYYTEQFAVINHTVDSSITDTMLGLLESVFMTEPVAGTPYVVGFVIVVAVVKLTLSCLIAIVVSFKKEVYAWQ